MKIKNPIFKWLISLTECALVFLVIYLGTHIAQNLPAPRNFGDYALIALAILLTLLVSGYLFLLCLADFPPLENSLINQVYSPALDGELTPLKRLATWVGTLVREDTRLMRQAHRAAEKPENTEFMLEVMERADRLRSRGEREVLLRYSLSMLESRRKAFKQAQKDAARLAKDKPPKPAGTPRKPLLPAKPHTAAPRTTPKPPPPAEPRRGSISEGESPKRKPGLRPKR